MDLLTVDEAARELRVSPITIRRYIKSGRLKCVRLGRLVRLSRDELDGLTASGVDAILSAKPTSDEDPLWRIVGLGASARREVHGKEKYRELAEAYDAKMDRDQRFVAAMMRGEAVNLSDIDE